MATRALVRLPPPRAAVRTASRGTCRRPCWRRAASSDPGAASSPTVNAPVRFDLDLSDDERGWLDARDEFRVLVLGKTGVGKSTMINALVDGNSPVGALEVGTTQCLRFENELNDAHAVSVWDAPGFFDVEGRTPAGVLRELSANVADYHAVVYAHVATDRRLRLEDEQSIDFIVRALGPALASRVVVALTYANELSSATAPAALDVRAAQLRALFLAAVERVGGSPHHIHAADDAPHVAVGAPGDGWESTLWSALVRRARVAADVDDAPDPRTVPTTPPRANSTSTGTGSARQESSWKVHRHPRRHRSSSFARSSTRLWENTLRATARDARSSRRNNAGCPRFRGDRRPRGARRCESADVDVRVDAHARRVDRYHHGGSDGSAAGRGRPRAGGAAPGRRGNHRRRALRDGRRRRKRGPVTFTFDPSDGSFSSDLERWRDGRVIEIDDDTGDAVVYARRDGEKNEETNTTI